MMDDVISSSSLKIGDQVLIKIYLSGSLLETLATVISEEDGLFCYYLANIFYQPTIMGTIPASWRVDTNVKNHVTVWRAALKFGLDPNAPNYWFHDASVTIIEIVCNLLGPDKKYPNECPCGIHHSRCSYHKE